MSWIRRHAGGLRTASVSVVVALLVWVVAEGESLGRERLDIPVLIQADAQSGWMVAAAGSGWSGRVFVELDGPTSAVTRVRDRLRQGLLVAPGDQGVPLEPGTHAIDLAGLLRQTPGVSGSGVAIATVEPALLTVMIERIQTREVDVTVVMPGDAEVSAVVAQPRRVRLTFPSAALPLVDEGVEIAAVVSPDQLAALSLGDRATVRDVPLRLPVVLEGQPFVRLDPAAVSVIATLEDREDSVTLDTVPVQIQRPAFQAERWSVRVEEEDQLLTGVVVSGPAELIARIRAGELRVFATVTLSPDDLDNRVTRKEVRFADLPTPLRFESPTRTVRVTIERVGG